MINLPHLYNIRDIERIREQTTYANHSLGMLLYALTLAKCNDITKLDSESQLKEPRRIVEIGYFIGYSALMFTAALADSGQSGKVVSIDIAEHKLGKYNMAIQEQLPDYHHIIVGDSVSVVEEVLKTLAGPIDILFIDGDHSHEGCKRDYEAYAPHLVDDGLLLFHDNYNPNIRAIIDEIQGWEFANLGGWAGLTVGTRKPYCWEPVQ